MLHSDTRQDLQDLYWETRQRRLTQSGGKINAALAAAHLVEKLSCNDNQLIRVAEMGCGEGHLLGLIWDYTKRHKTVECVGIDSQPQVIERAAQLYPMLHFKTLDYAKEGVSNLGMFDVVLLVNTLHEVFSACRLPGSAEVDIREGKRQVRMALTNVLNAISPVGHLVLFDGVEHPLGPASTVAVVFRSDTALAEFERFTIEYEAVNIRYVALPGNRRIEINLGDFTRYITKTLFLDSPLWEIERHESYQYFTEVEFAAVLADLGLELLEVGRYSPNLERWSELVSIETPGVAYPDEHIMVVAERTIDKCLKGATTTVHT